MGVRLFFVLSGFLITGILLRCRRLVAAGQPFWPTAGRFYARRFLRIFPLFYFVLFSTAVLHLPGVRETIFWHLSYLSNIYFAIHGWNDAVSHFWSLAVEEQFYFLWPWLIILIPTRFLVKIMLGAIILAPLFRLVGTLAGLNAIAVMVLPFSCLDTLGLGGLLAVIDEGRISRQLDPNRLAAAGFWLGLPLLLLMLVLQILETGGLARTVFFDFAVALSGVWLIRRASQGFSGRAGRLLESPVLVYLGTISYGLYVYHNIMVPMGPYALQRLGIGPLWWPILFAYRTAITIAIATLSWYLLERPISNLKKYFGYRLDRPALSSGPSMAVKGANGIGS